MKEKSTKIQKSIQSMKMLLMLLILFIPIFRLEAQVTIGAGTAPQKFSILEVVSNQTGGLRLPHLTTSQRNTLSATTDFIAEDQRGNASVGIDPGLGLGLTIYNTDTNCTEYWNGYKWVSLCLGTANIILKSPCGNYDPQNPPLAPADGSGTVCEYTPEDTPACTVSSGKAYDVYLTAGDSYAFIVVDDLTSAFTLTFQPNNSSYVRNAVVRVVNNCTGEFKDFVFTQAGASCPTVPDPVLNTANLSLCGGGSVVAHVVNSQPGTDYIWTFSGVIVHTGNWYEIKRAGIYNVHAGLLGCGTAATLTVTDNSVATASDAVTITVTNGGILCAGGTVVLTANTTQSLLWYQNGIPLSGANKNNNPLSLSGTSAAGEWFAVVQDGGCASNSSNRQYLIDNTATGTALPQPTATVNGQPLTGGNIVICKDGTLKLEVTNPSAYPQCH